jgi:hypothetical protein
VLVLYVSRFSILRGWRRLRAKSGATRYKVAGAGQTTKCFLARMQPCDSCGAAAPLRCTTCKSARYCGAACQHRDWPAHKHRCVAPAAAIEGDVARALPPLVPLADLRARQIGRSYNARQDFFERERDFRPYGEADDDDDGGDDDDDDGYVGADLPPLVPIASDSDAAARALPPLVPIASDSDAYARALPPLVPLESLSARHLGAAYDDDDDFRVFGEDDDSSDDDRSFDDRDDALYFGDEMPPLVPIGAFGGSVRRYVKGVRRSVGLGGRETNPKDFLIATIAPRAKNLAGAIVAVAQKLQAGYAWQGEVFEDFFRRYLKRDSRNVAEHRQKVYEMVRRIKDLRDKKGIAPTQKGKASSGRISRASKQTVSHGTENALAAHLTMAITATASGADKFSTSASALKRLRAYAANAGGRGLAQSATFGLQGAAAMSAFEIIERVIAGLVFFHLQRYEAPRPGIAGHINDVIDNLIPLDPTDDAAGDRLSRTISNLNLAATNPPEDPSKSETTLSIVAAPKPPSEARSTQAQNSLPVAPNPQTNATAVDANVTASNDTRTLAEGNLQAEAPARVSVEMAELRAMLVGMELDL